MGRIWKQGIDPKTMHDKFGLYQGIWMPQMDRYWYCDDYSVMSRLINTEWGKVEHVAIQRRGSHTSDGEGDIPWSEKQAIKNELFGENRIAIEVYPKEKALVDVMDIYHLWVFDKKFEMPFGIHPQDKQCRNVKRGSLPVTQQMIDDAKRGAEC